ncbi:HupE/UreJ family protein [Donghicola tyrosinivorans]|uniref:HupE/UreJ protein n=1 Tax=Donghicola tyrosinivorans TaxID=1652492 RepID=A0A2T0WEN9_9RHOB|nr:HupE/UreJ family protein [Donghicola tyrosinivorans]PRY85179.1 HupE/UreJ protein [Donghicola tyrosinivorans]
MMIVIRVWLAALVSSVLLVPHAQAHEVTPTITDFSVVDGSLSVTMRANVEAFLAGIDLEGLEDTNASAQVDTYDRLRALEPDALTQDVTTYWPQMAGDLQLETDQGPVTAILSGVEVEPQPDLELPRVTVLTLQADLPANASTLTIGWPANYGAMIVRQNGVEDPYTAYLAAGTSTDPVAITGGYSLGAAETFLTYIPVGFDHILPKGLDHILFVLGLFFLSTQLKPLLWQISAFTLAHTVTLALGALGLVAVPGAIVEPLIAASITFVAVENILTRGLSPWRPVVVFVFGLLHGLGFASVLGEFGLPQSQFVPALIGFNVGVEIGQLTVIALAFLAVGFWFGDKPWYRKAISVPASLVIGAIGAYWFVERAFGL